MPQKSSDKPAPEESQSAADQLSGTTPAHEMATSLLQDKESTAIPGQADVRSLCTSLNRSDEILHTLIANIPDCVKILTLEGRLLTMSNRGQELLEIDNVVPYIGTLWQSWWPEESRPAAEHCVKTAREGISNSFELSAPTAKGKVRRWLTTISPLKDEEGRPERLLAVSRDVTERYQTNQNLVAMEQKFSTAFANSVMGMVLSDSKGVVLQANQAFCHIVGRPLEELMGKTSAHYTHQEDIPQNIRSLGRIEQHLADSANVQKRYIRPDGSVVWTQVSITRLPDSQPEEHFIIATVEDITQQVLAQQALKDREQHLRLIFESLKDYAIMTVDVDGRVTEWNAGAERVFGYQATEIIGKNSSILWTDEQRNSHAPEQEWRQARENGGWDGERWQQRKDGSIFFSSGRLRPMYDESHRLIGYTKVCQDITAQRESTKQLAEAKAKVARAREEEHDRLLNVFKRSPAFMAVLSGSDHVFTLVNDEYNQLIGHRDIIGKPVRAALPELEGQGFYELLDKVYSSGEAYQGNDIPVLLQRKTGEPLTECYVDFVYMPARDSDGKITGILVHGVDQTERRSAEKSIETLAEQRRLALDAAGMGWWHLDVVTGRADWDSRVKDMLGITNDDMLLGDVISIMFEEDRAQVQQAIASALDVENPRPYFVEYRVRHTDGSIRCIQSKGQAYFRDKPYRQAVSLVGTSLDITDMKNAQDALRRSEAYFRELADAMPQIVFTAQPDGTVDYFNKRWYEYTGLPEGTVHYDYWKQVHTEEGLARAMIIWPEATRTGSPYEIEYQLRRHDGVYRWHLGRALPIYDDQGKITRWFGTNTDIHDAKQLQQQNEALLQSERIAREDVERASRLKDEFLATLSHELRTPLSAILGWCTLLSADPQADDLSLGLETIERNARAQSQIIEDLLDMSAIISGKLRLHVQQTDLVPLVRTAVETVRPAAEAKGVKLETILDPQARPVSGDPNRLQQIFWNLLSNAVKFTPKGGRVQVVLARVNSHLEFSVSDSGEGIESEFLPMVFDRFRQADATITRRHGGLGLGLAIVKQLAELHGGTVKAYSDGPGEGSKFVVSLPLAVIHSDSSKEGIRRHPAASSSNLPIPGDVLKLEGLKVLVVDDEPDARDLVRRFLKDCKADVRTAGSAEEALEQFKTDPPEILVSDIGMPYEDGYTLIKKVRALPAEKGGNIPAIALTAYARTEDRVKAVLSGFQMHVAKPAEAAELLTMVARLSGRMEL